MNTGSKCPIVQYFMGVPVCEQSGDCADHLVCNSANCYSISWCVGVSFAVLFLILGAKKNAFSISNPYECLCISCHSYCPFLTINHALRADHEQYWPGSKALPNILVEGAALDAVNPEMHGDAPAHRLRTCVLYVCV